MQVSVESVGNLERRMSFSLPAERLDTHIGGRLRELSRTARIKGFRPGKVPAKVIEQRYGDQVRAEALDGLLRETFNNAVREQDLQLRHAFESGKVQWSWGLERSLQERTGALALTFARPIISAYRPVQFISEFRKRG